MQAVLNAGLQSLQGGQERVERAAGGIARATTAEQGATMELTQALVELRVAEAQAEAGVAVLRTANAVLGTLIDTHA